MTKVACMPGNLLQNTDMWITQTSNLGFSLPSLNIHGIPFTQ